MRLEVSDLVSSLFNSSKVRNLKYLFLLILVLVALPARTFGQNATLVGTVTDPQGGVVAGVTITITSAETGAVKTITTNDAGQYVVPDLAIGHYFRSRIAIQYLWCGRIFLQKRLEAFRPEKCRETAPCRFELIERST